MASGPGIAAVPSWTVSLLLILLVSISLAFEGLMNYLKRRWKKQRKRALLKFLSHMRDELLLVGFISLVLSTFQYPLSGICYSSSSSRRLRNLLALAAASPPGSNYTSSSTPCSGPGQQQLWPISVQHETHLLLFTIAIMHLAYSTLTIVFAKYLIGRWDIWEERCMRENPLSWALKVDNTDMVPPPLFGPGCLTRWRIHLSTMSHGMTRWIIAFMLHFQGVTWEMYRDARTLFIVDLPLGSLRSTVVEDLASINFHSLLEDTLETNLADIINAGWELWVVAIVIIAIPAPEQVSLIFGCSSFLVMTIVGLKLVVCMTILTRQVQLRAQLAAVEDSMIQGDHLSVPQPALNVQHSLQRNFSFAVNFQNPRATVPMEASGASARERKRLILWEELEGGMKAQSLVTYTRAQSLRRHRLEAKMSQQSHRVSIEASNARGSDRLPSTSQLHSGLALTSVSFRLSMAKRVGGHASDTALFQAPHDIMNEVHGVVEQSPPSKKAPLSPSELEAVAVSPPPDSVLSAARSGYNNKPLEGQPEASVSIHTALTDPHCRTAVDQQVIEAQGLVSSNKGVEREPWWRHYVPFLSPTDNSFVRRAVQRFRTESPLPLAYEDATDLMWFKSPGLLIALMQVVFFVNALNLAVATFAIYELICAAAYSTQYTNFGVTSWVTAVILLAVAMSMIVYSTFCVIPLLALMMPLSSKCSTAVIKRAMKEEKQLNELGQPVMTMMPLGSTLDSEVLGMWMSYPGLPAASNHHRHKQQQVATAAATTEAEEPRLAAITEISELSSPGEHGSFHFLKGVNEHECAEPAVHDLSEPTNYNNKTKVSHEIIGHSL
ncbi:hypothetical protein CEUSTIGMA_g2341.t1 [Chlamydomonas eustigma]|uniref:MLO-like protein n=1 Tax=Chlamydomonas eustigma TaxID=1157962 RepID=A0A250WVS2_9CHLO|nr:hypothetical protein CEUSTIGMA_g2341.t1 [Chlamydomonas eustigma]|eukprot:GAX74895.1 hypothetical protein CEUSTIGMA_g2341.t1 [Chlamydomonas eustigma]